MFFPAGFHRIFTEDDKDICFKAGKCVVLSESVSSKLPSLVALRARIFTPVGSPFLCHQLDEVAVTRIQLKLLTDVNPLHHSSIITCFQRQVIHRLTCSQNKRWSMLLHLFFLLFPLSHPISSALPQCSFTSSNLQLLLWVNLSPILRQKPFSYLHYCKANLKGRSGVNTLSPVLGYHQQHEKLLETIMTTCTYYPKFSQYIYLDFCLFA